MTSETCLPPPFSHLDPDSQKQIRDRLRHTSLSPGAPVFTQEISAVDSLWMIEEGQATYFYRHLSGERTLKGSLKPGDFFGGLSLIYTDRIALHSLEITRETFVQILDAPFFLKLVKGIPVVADFFALEFGRLLRHPLFKSVLARQTADRQMILPFFNQPCSSIFRPNIITCSPSTPVSQAALKMAMHQSSAILVKDPDHPVDAIVTDADLKSKILAQNMSSQTPVSRIASSPVVSVQSDSQVFEAFITMVQEDKRHLVVRGHAGNVTGILCEKDLITAQAGATYLLIKSVKSARNMEELADIHQRMEQMLLPPISSGTRADHVTRLIATISDAIIAKAVEFSLRETGPSPCAFSFLTMGSEGRMEQTLISDQDNAIVFEDLPPKEHRAAKDYFDRLARSICQKLDQSGYRYCEGDNMAQNPRWCQPLNVWKSYFKNWILSASPEDLLHASIFFDFRGTLGDISLASALRKDLFRRIEKWPGFLRNMTENTLELKPPLTFFGNFVLETLGEAKNTINIKYAMLPIVDFARIFALKNGIDQTHTLDRLFRLYTGHVLTGKEYTDIVQAYHFLMGLRFRRQITTIMDEKQEPDNRIFPDNLSTLDRIMLKETFKIIQRLQQRLNIEFTGVV